MAYATASSRRARSGPIRRTAGSAVAGNRHGSARIAGPLPSRGGCRRRSLYSANAQSAFKLAHARGAALLVLAESGLKVASYSPAEVKGSVTGSGNADKSQIQFMLPSLLDLAEAPAPRCLRRARGGHLPRGSSSCGGFAMILLLALLAMADPTLVLSKRFPGSGRVLRSSNHP